MKIAIYTHSDYKDIFKIQRDHLLKQTQLEPVIFTNVPEDEVYSGFEIIPYNGSLSFSKRIKYCLEQYAAKYDSQYVMLFQENDIIMNIDVVFVQKLFDCMPINNLDRVNFWCYDFLMNPDKIVFDSSNPDVYLVRNRSFYLYSVGPSIWKISTLVDLFSGFDLSYKDIENPASDRMISQGKRVYHLISTKNVYREFLTRNCLDEVCWLHVTTAGQFAFDKKSEFLEYVKKLYEDYKVTRNIYSYRD